VTGLDMKSVEFVRRISETKISTIDRAVAVLWFHGLRNENIGLSVKEVCKHIEQAGCAKQNVTTIKQLFRRDRRVIKGPGDTYLLRPQVSAELNEKYSCLINATPLVKCDAVLPTDLFENARGYIKKVALQLNASYLYCLFDCCAVMCRRLLETLIIETYEALNRADEIKDRDGHYLMFSGLLAYIEKDKNIHMGRNALNGLKSFKKLGDLSAHNRRFNARKTDIDQVKSDLRISCEELLHLAGQEPSRM
jgi:hypothetical protein